MSIANEAKLCSPNRSTFEVLVVPCAVRHCLGKNWALPIDQWRLKMLQFSVHFIDLLSILRCNGFAEIQKAVVDQSSSRLPVTMTFLGCIFGYGSALEVLLGSTTELVVTSCHIKSIFHRTSKSDQEMVHCCCLK